MRFVLQFAFSAILLFFISSLSCWSQSLSSSNVAVANPVETLLLRRFEERYRTPASLSATFLERYLENGRVVRAEAGQAYFLRPGKMRWEYESPEKNLFLVDGKSAWFYVPADHTVTRVPAKESADWRTPLALLAGRIKLSRICTRIQPAVDATKEAPEDTVFSCELRRDKTKPEDAGTQQSGPQKESAAPTVLFELATNSADLVKLVVHDPAGVTVEFHFKNWQFDPPIEDSLFRFRVPPGVAIVNGELSAGQNSLNP